MQSYNRSVQSKLKEQLSECDKKIPETCHYIIHVSFISGGFDSPKLNKIYGPDFSANFPEPVASILYTPTDILILYCVEDSVSSHMHDGSCQKIVSLMSSYMTLKFKQMCTCQIIYSSSRITLYSYMVNVSQNAFTTFLQNSGINTKDIRSLTQQELLEKCGKKGIDISKTDKFKLYGNIYKTKGVELQYNSMDLNFSSATNNVEILFNK